LRLAGKLILIFVLAVILITAGFCYFTINRSYQRAKIRQLEYAKKTVDQLHKELKQTWQEDGDVGLEKYIQRVSQDSEVKFNWVWLDDPEADKYQGVLWETLPESPGEYLSIRSRSNGQRLLYTYCRLKVGGQRRGGIEFVSSLRSVDEQTAETIFQSLLMIGLIALLSIGIILIAGIRFVARPLQQLIAKTERIGDGQFSNPLQLKGNDELSQLGKAVNEMCVRLQRQQHLIEQETSQRLETQNQLRHADRLKTVGRLAAGIAHEIGSPLGVVSGRAAMIETLTAKESSENSNRIGENAKIIKSESDRIANTVRQLLDFARPNRPMRNPTRLDTLCNETLELVKTLTESKQIEFLFEIDSSITSIESNNHSPSDLTNKQETTDHHDAVTATIDRGQIQQVITNLLVNAIQSIEENGTIKVSLGVTRTTSPVSELYNSQASKSGNDFNSVRDYQTIEIQDDGEGIDEQNQKHLFEPFFTTKGVGQGTGLGLSISYGIVKEHGGWIDVQSQKQRGTRFTVFLPKEIPEDNQASNDDFDKKSD